MAAEGKDDNYALELVPTSKTRLASYSLPSQDDDDSGRVRFTVDNELDDVTEREQVESSDSYSLHEERAVVRKLDRRLVLLLALLYMLAFLDRSSAYTDNILGDWPYTERSRYR